MQLTQFVHRSLRASPEAVMTIPDGRVRTSRESVDRIKRLAGGLQTLGLRTGDRVAILASNSDYYHEALLACWWFGAVASPVNLAGARRKSGTPWKIQGRRYYSWTRILLPSDLPFARRVQA